jgi:hypothetical protein
MSDDLLNVDLDHLTVGEIEEIEDLTGLSIDAFGEKGKPKGKMLRAIGYVTRKRTDPAYTWEAAGNLRVELGSAPVPPTAAAD